MKHAIHPYIYTIILIVSALLPTTLQAQTAKFRVHGQINDAETKEALPYISVRIRNTTNGCCTDNNGLFSFMVPAMKDTLIVSCIGYKEKRIPLTAKTKFPLRVALSPDVSLLSEVVIKPKKEKYKKKNNPAVELARKLIEHREDGSPKNKDFYSRDRHERLNIALNNFNSSEESHFGKKFSFLDQYIDTSLISGKPILHISSRELLATDYHRKEPHSERQYVKARQRAGIDDVVSDESIEAIFEETFKDVDIFQDNITIFRNKFVSPISTIGLSFYKYYLMDTVEIDGVRCTDLAFTPHNPESMGFSGHLYVATDSTYFVKLAQMNVPKDINLNFIQYMNIKLDFDRLEDGTRILNNESLVTEFQIVNAVNGIYAHRQVDYRNHCFEAPPEATENLHSKSLVDEEEEATNRDKEYWEAHRISEPTAKEQSVEQMMQQLRSNPVYYWLEKGITFMFTGWIPLREKNPPVFYGPVNTSISHNALEGVRLRTGAMTSAYLHPQLFGTFFLAYGLKDKELKYMGELEYSFHKKKEHPNEFPIHSLRLNYENDVFQYGQTYMHTNKDNMFLTLKRKEDNKIGYIRKAEFTYTQEFHNHFSYALTLRNRVDIATHLIPFERTTTLNGTTTSTFVDNLRQSEVELNLRYAPKEKFIQTKWNRHSVLPEHPVFTLSHRVGIKGIAGSELNYQHTELGFKKRFWLSAFGYTDCILNSANAGNKVPFPLLIIPNANLSYTIQKESYALMNAMEFFNDEYASWDLTYYMSGLIFNRLPLIRKLNWREVIGFRGMYGNLSEKNRPDNMNTGTLYKFPYEDETYHYLNSTPYMELSLGVENIFRVLRIDYVRRLTYRDYPGIDKEGVRIQLHMQF